MFVNEHIFKPLKCDCMVMIDPGHGGIVNGKYTTAPSKMCDYGDFVFYEGVFNRQVALRVAEYLKIYGIGYMFVTQSNKDESLYKRVKRANDFNFDRKIYLSLHGNAAGVESATGIETFTSPGQTESDIIATCIYNKLEKMGWRMRSDKTDGDVDKESRFYVLVKTKMPAILIESGFFTNREQALQMMDSMVQEEIALLIAEGIKYYLYG